jgi:DNA polymerase-3 subunit delta
LLCENRIGRVVAVKNHDADRLLSRLPSHVFAYLVFGTDIGLISERTRKIVRSTVSDPHDPFQLVRIDGDQLATDPLRLVDEAGTVGLFGGHRAIWIEAGLKNFAAAVEPLFANPPLHCTLVIEAGGLKKDAPLRKLFERERTALAIECYPDRHEDIARLIETEAACAGLAISAETRDILSSFLGADRLTTRSELAKLLLYAHGTGQITRDHVEAIVADASALALDAAVNGAFSGDYAAVSDTSARVFAGGGDPGALLAAALRHALMLHKVKLEADKGTSLDIAVERAARAHASFSRRSNLDAQVRAWPATKLVRAIDQLAEAIRRCRRQADLAEVTAVRALWTIALMAKGRT